MDRNAAQTFQATLAEPGCEKDKTFLNPILTHAEAKTAFRALRRELLERGALASDSGGTLLRLLVWAVFLSASLVVAWTSQSLLIGSLAVFLTSILQAQFAFIGHDASHGAAVDGQSRNRLVGLICMGVVGGLCFEEWQSRHLKHHKHCQDEANDPDMQFDAAFSLSVEAVAQKGPVSRWLAPYQAYYFWPSTLLFAHSLRVLSIAAAANQPKKYGRDLLAVGVHAVLWLLVPLLLPGVELGRVLLVYLAASSLLGLRLAAVFTVNHIGMPQASSTSSHLEHQVLTSRNISTSRWLDWFFGGMNFQIEHHLFPSCSRVHLRRASHAVRPVIQELGLRYERQSWGRAVLDVTRHVAGVAAEARVAKRHSRLVSLPDE